MSSPLSVRVWMGVAGCLLAMVVSAALATSARADFQILDFDGLVTNADGSGATQAGAHPFEATSSFVLTSTTDSAGSVIPDGNVRTIFVELPAGFVGNPAAVLTCTEEQLRTGATEPPYVPACPVDSQVGVTRMYFTLGGPEPTIFKVPVYNMVPPAGQPVRFGFNPIIIPLHASASVRTGGDYGVTFEMREVSQAAPLIRGSMTFWGVPADPAHDSERAVSCFGPPESEFCFGAGEPSPGVRKPFLTNPTDCSAGPVTTTLRADSWQDKGAFRTASFVSHLPDGTPAGVDGCERLPFDPSMTAAVDTTSADAPAGLSVELAFPQDGLLNPDGLAPAHLKRARVTLPEGMTISPASADGLAACSDDQLGLDDGDPVKCPDASRIGSVVAETPLLAEPLEGGVFVRSQGSSDPESGEMFRIALVLANDERGVLVKLGGSVRADAESGRLEATFDNNPQLPVSKVTVRLNGGPRAPLATPTDCGPKTIAAELTSWAGQVASLTDSVTIDCPGVSDFAPAFRAGSVSPTGGAFSPFTARIDRPAGHRFLSGVTVELPNGLVAKLRGVPLCGSGQAAGGSCPTDSRIGTATVGAGPGARPFFLQGGVYLTEGYRGGPYGLAVHVHAKAGPFDLGVVRVRQAIYVDPVTAELTVVSDPLPQIVKGVPVRLRTVNVDVDRPGFTVNPTSCSEKRVGAKLTAIGGTVRMAGSRFQVGDCRALAFRPRMAMRLVGKRRTRTGAHPALKAVLTQSSGQANLARAEVGLPESLALDPDNSSDPALVCDYDRALRADCPPSSVVGRATAFTPLLDRPIAGNVYLVQGVRLGPTGNRIRTLPTLLVKLRGEVAIDLRARTDVKAGRLVTIFPKVPDARVSRFSLRIHGGRRGILVITRSARARIDVCKSRQIALVEADAQNGRRADFGVRMKAPCAKKARTPAR